MIGRVLPILLLASWTVLLPATGSGQTEGTYRFVLCEEACATTDTVGAVAAGTLVLFPDSAFATEIPTGALEDLRRSSRWLVLRGGGFNACFRIPRRVARVGGYELFAGITEAGLTRWHLEDGELKVLLYQSPDGHFLVVGEAEGGWIRGRGEQTHGYERRPPDRAFLAKRVGPPDPGRCIGP